MTVAKFQKTEGGKIQGATVIYHESDHNLGGRNLDWKLMQEIAKFFNEQSEGTNPLDYEANKIHRIKLLRAAQKAREDLTSSTDIVIDLTD